MAASFAKMRGMTRAELIREHDDVAKSTGGSLMLLRDELSRRDFEDQNGKMIAYTKQVRDMTIAITVLTVIVAFMTAVNLSLVL